MSWNQIDNLEACLRRGLPPLRLGGLWIYLRHGWRRSDMAMNRNQMYLCCDLFSHCCVALRLCTCMRLVLYNIYICVCVCVYVCVWNPYYCSQIFRIKVPIPCTQTTEGKTTSVRRHCTRIAAIIPRVSNQKLFRSGGFLPVDDLLFWKTHLCNAQ